MTRRVRIALACCLGLVAAAPLVAGVARADETLPADDLALLETLSGTADEKAALAASLTSHHVKARELAEKILREHPDSYAAHYVLGVAMHYGEGDLARSVFHLQRSTELYERRHGRVPAEPSLAFWHMIALTQLTASLEEMNRPAEQLATLDRFAALYKQPDRTAMRVWPLMKLRRYDEARAVARAVIASGDQENTLIAKTGLCATEFEAGDRQAAYAACVDAVAAVEHAGGGEMEYSNAAEAALAVYKFDEAERYIQEAINRVGEGWGNPYRDLAALYLGEGRVTEAIEALKGAQRLRMSRPAWLDQHGQARVDFTVAALLLVVGETERGLQLAERAESRPDRVGIWSGTEAQSEVASAVLVAMARREMATRLEEQAVTSGILEGARLRLRAIEERVGAWHERRRAAVLFSDEALLEGTLRPYFVGGSNLFAWLVPEVMDVVGAGVTLAALQHAQGKEPRAARAYFDAFAAEASFERGDLASARASAEAALAALPRAEVLLGGRAAAIAGEAARRLGDPSAATAHFSTAMVRDPDVMRRLELALPVRVETDGSAVARAAATLVGKSPRFDVVGSGFVVALRGGESLEACLYGPMHEMLQCTTLAPEPARPAIDQARKLVAALHKVAFAYKADLSQADLTTLDGSPTAGRAEKQVKSLLDTLGGAAPDSRAAATASPP